MPFSARAVATRISQLSLCATVTVSGLCAQPTLTTVRTITLDEAVRLAQQNSPATISARNAVRSGDAAVRNALAQFLPNLSAYGSASRAAGETFFQGQLVPYKGDAWSYSKGYGASVLLFDGGLRWLNYRAASAARDASESTDLSQAFVVAQDVKLQYFAVLAARESESAGQRQLEQAEHQMDIARTRIRAGAAVRLDSIRSAIAVVNARLAILSARGALQNANASLTRLVASPVPVTAVAADTLDVGLISVDSAALVALAESGPAVRAAQLSAAAARSARIAATTGYLPTLSAGYSYGASNTSPSFTCCGGPASSSTRLSFSVSYNIFDNLRRETGLTSALIAESNADATLRDARVAARESLTQSLTTYQTAQESIELQQLNIAAAEEDLAAQQQRYAFGAGALLDVLNAQSALETARAALVSARYQARSARAQIETLIGRDLR
jgi:outer membrane protein